MGQAVAQPDVSCNLGQAWLYGKRKGTVVSGDAFGLYTQNFSLLRVPPYFVLIAVAPTVNKQGLCNWVGFCEDQKIITVRNMIYSLKFAYFETRNLSELF